MIVAQSLAAVKAGLSPGGARSPLVPIHRGRALANPPGTPPDRSVLTNHPLYCGSLLLLKKYKFYQTNPSQKFIKHCLPMEYEKPCALSAHKTNPIHARNLNQSNQIQTNSNQKMKLTRALLTLFNPLAMKNTVTFADHWPCYSPSPGGEGRGEGELKTPSKLKIAASCLAPYAFH